jgi:hypothetical protein
MACNCGSAATAWQSAPKDAPVKVFEGPDARAQAEMYAGRNGGGHVRAMDPAVAPVLIDEE